jgi:hypothetical protein
MVGNSGAVRGSEGVVVEVKVGVRGGVLVGVATGVDVGMAVGDSRVR